MRKTKLGADTAILKGGSNSQNTKKRLHNICFYIDKKIEGFLAQNNNGICRLKVIRRSELTLRPGNI